MEIINLPANAYWKPGTFIADILVDEGSTAVIIKINDDESEKNIDEYDLLDEYLKITNARKVDEISPEDEYNAFTKWLESHTDIDEIYVTYDLLRYFFVQFEEECFIDPVDGFAKFPDSEED